MVDTRNSLPAGFTYCMAVTSTAYLGIVELGLLVDTKGDQWLNLKRNADLRSFRKLREIKGKSFQNTFDMYLGGQYLLLNGSAEMVFPHDWSRPCVGIAHWRNHFIENAGYKINTSERITSTCSHLLHFPQPMIVPPFFRIMCAVALLYFVGLLQILNCYQNISIPKILLLDMRMYEHLYAPPLFVSVSVSVSVCVSVCMSNYVKLRLACSIQ